MLEWRKATPRLSTLWRANHDRRKNRRVLPALHVSVVTGAASVLDATNRTSRYATADAALSKDQFGGQDNVVREMGNCQEAQKKKVAWANFGGNTITTMNTEPVKLVCSTCKTEPKQTLKGRLPRGWKRLEAELVCSKCWHDRFFLRAITFAVSGPIVKEDWPALREALQEGWSQSTRLCNWASTELAKADVIRQPNMDKLPRFDPPYLYPDARKLFPGLASQTVVALLNTVQRKYAQARYERIWLGNVSLQSYKYPVPLPVPAAGYACELMKRGEDRVPVVHLRIGDTRFSLLLRGGIEWARQLHNFTLLVKGQAEQCEAAIGRRLVTESDTWNGVQERDAGGGTRRHYRIMLKLVAWLPRKVDGKKQKVKELSLKTGKECFWRAELDGGKPWLLHADHVRRWVLSHANRLQHLSDDQKFEQRRTAQARRPLNEHRGQLARKQNDRLDTWCHTAAALFTQWCVRQRVTRVQYDETGGYYLEKFPWHRIKTLLKEKLNVAGIDFAEVASVAVPEESSTSTRADVKS